MHVRSVLVFCGVHVCVVALLASGVRYVCTVCLHTVCVRYVSCSLCLGLVFLSALHLRETWHLYVCSSQHKTRTIQNLRPLGPVSGETLSQSEIDFYIDGVRDMELCMQHMHSV